jgi:hypothetical protein
MIALFYPRVFGALALTALTCRAASNDPVDFFKSRVNPILVSKCHTCHTNLKMGGLQLDSFEHLLKGGNSGPAVVPGSADQSRLIRAVSYVDERLKMPPQGKLSDEQIADLRTWINSGAHWVDSEPSPAAQPKEYVITREQRKFWAFQPVRKPELPEVRRASWVRSPIDRFILASLEAKGLEPAQPCDKITLIRRATFDLIGLPPTPDEVDAFLHDRSPGAFAKVVDRLLASPHYGERWGRFWLDVARYADVDVLFPDGENFANAFRYRDWVIQVLNRDMPYDLFVKAQIAGDLIEDSEANKNIPKGSLRPGLGLFALGPWYYKIVEPPKARADERHDRVDVLTRGFLGLTVACARCHDHKYDPIPTKDYYAISGVFANTEAKEYPLASADVVKRYDDQQKKIDEQEERIKKALAEERTRIGAAMARETYRYLMAALPNASPQTAPGLDSETVERFRKYVVFSEKSHPYLRVFDRQIASGATASELQATAEGFQALVKSARSQREEIDKYNERVIEESKKSTDPYDIFCKGCNVVTRSLERDVYVLWTDLFGEEQRSIEKAPGLFYYGDKDIDRFLSPQVKARIDAMRAELESLKKALPEHYPFLHVISDVEHPLDLKQALRGDPYNLGDPVPRHFLRILSDGSPVSLQAGSGRMELADAIASPQNPLTARVMVNRIWQHHFGTGIVRTPSNFGQVGSRPSHPELLDYLAVKFVESGWSMKAIHREIMLSSVYALSSGGSLENEAADPDNTLFRRANRQRLDVEAMRDAILSVSGKLDLSVGGKPFEWDKGVNRRTVYGKVSRLQMERMLTLFDFPTPDMTSEQRPATNVPPQRLFFLNSDLVTQAARDLSERLHLEASDDPRRIRRAYKLLYGRDVSEPELQKGLAFLGAVEPGDQLAWQRYAQVLLASNEFSFLD